MLAFSALLGLAVGAIVVGQTLFSLTEGRLRELATLKAMGASDREVLAFIGWQAAGRFVPEPFVAHGADAARQLAWIVDAAQHGDDVVTVLGGGRKLTSLSRMGAEPVPEFGPAEFG